MAKLLYGITKVDDWVKILFRKEEKFLLQHKLRYEVLCLRENDTATKHIYGDKKVEFSLVFDDLKQFIDFASEHCSDEDIRDAFAEFEKWERMP